MTAAGQNHDQGPQGYTSCACRDCFDIAIGTPGEALCLDCQDAGCEAGVEQECQREDAYGDEDRDENEDEPQVN